MANHYSTLGVPPTAMSDDIRHSYHQSAKQCHPDKCGGSDEATSTFQKLQTAYQILSNPAQRAQYDRELTVSSPLSRASESATGSASILATLDKMKAAAREMKKTAEARATGK